jgi:probable F420-dependent oxidoreductase
VLIAPLRPALLLAKTVATLDVLSGGRLDLGVGLGWQREEFAASGVPFAKRGARLEDQLRACRALWSGGPASFRSETVSFDELRCFPRPLQPGGPPLWLGVAANERNAARMAELGAGWLPMESEPEAIARGVALLRRAFATAGRDPDTLGVRANAPVASDAAGRPDLDATLAALPRLRDAGVSIAGFALARFVRSQGEIPAFLARLAGR